MKAAAFIVDGILSLCDDALMPHASARQCAYNPPHDHQECTTRTIAFYRFFRRSQITIGLKTRVQRWTDIKRIEHRAILIVIEVKIRTDGLKVFQTCLQHGAAKEEHL